MLPSANSRCMTIALLLLFCILTGAQLFSIRANLQLPNKMATLSYKNNLTPNCSLTGYDEIIRKVSDYAYALDVKTGKKTITVLTMGGEVISVSIPFRTELKDEIIAYVRSTILQHQHAKDEKPCYSQQDIENKDGKSTYLPLLEATIVSNNARMKILDWVALALNLLAVGYFASALHAPR